MLQPTLTKKSIRSVSLVHMHTSESDSVFFAHVPLIAQLKY